MELEIPPHTTKTQLQLRNFVINFITVLLQFGCFKIHFMKIQLSFIILRNFFENFVHFSQNFKIPLLKNIVNLLNRNQSNSHRLNQCPACLLIHQWKNSSTAKSVNFHRLNQRKLFCIVKSANFHWSNQWNLTHR